MSTTCFLLLLLCISLNACKAHPLGTEKKTHFFPKNEGENVFGDSSAMKIGLKNEVDKGMEPNEFSGDVQKPKESESTGKYEEEADVSVNLGLPSKNLREANPKVTLDCDYPPDVHPPSHNSP